MSSRRYLEHYGIKIKTAKQIAGIRRACRDELAEHIKPGVTTRQLDARARELYAAAGAQPATLGYGDPPFPGSICTSLAEISHRVSSSFANSPRRLSAQRTGDSFAFCQGTAQRTFAEELLDRNYEQNLSLLANRSALSEWREPRLLNVIPKASLSPNSSAISRAFC